MSATSKLLHQISIALVFTSTVGLTLSYYAYIVEIAKEQDESYEAMCDISENISCTKAFMSEYGKGFGLIPPESLLYLPNCVYGLVFYAIIAILSTLNDNYIATTVVVSLGICSNILSIYLAYILYVINDICIICIGTYVVNIVILVLGIKKLRLLSQHNAMKLKQK